MIRPDELTGDQVRAARKTTKLGRKAFGQAAGVMEAAVWRAETKNEFKGDEREKLTHYINKLAREGEGSLGEDAEGDARVEEPEAREPAAEASEGTPATQDACGPCEHGHHSACRRGTPAPDQRGAIICCDGNVVFGRVPWEDAADIEAREQRERSVTVITWDEEEWEPSLVDVASEIPTPETTASALALPSDDDVLTVTNSQLGDARRCPRRWWLAWYRKLTPVYENFANARATGTRIHRALAAYYVADPSIRVDPRDALERVIIEDWTRLLEQHARQQGIDLNAVDPEVWQDDLRLADLQKKFHDATVLERIMVEGYLEWVAETGADQGLQVIASETVLSADLELKEEDDRWGTFTRPVRALGLLDVRLYREADGVRLFEDHKTVGDLRDPVATLPMNPQMLHYMLLEWLNTDDGEARCNGALYNMLRRVKRTDRARPPFYDRVEVRHNAHELESYRRRLLATSLQIARWKDSLDAGAHHLDVVPPTPTKDCRWDCAFFPICPLFDDGSRVEDAIQVHYVEADPLARYASIR